MDIARRQFCNSIAAGAGCLIAPRILYANGNNPWVNRDNKIKIGLLWSLTGVMSVIEKASRDVAMFWVDNVNRSGGIAGMEVVPVEVDTKSNMGPYREGVVKLIDDEKVLAVFGGYTSVSRRAVMPLVTLRNHLFYYPTVYEGRECWQNIICNGALSNQHSYDLIPYMVKNFGPRTYFVGSNYIWPKESNRNAKNWLSLANGELVGESYMPLGLGDFESILSDIKQKKPDWIFSTVVGDSDVYFRKKYIAAGLSPDKIPTAALTTSEAEVKAMGFEYGEGHYCSAPYFQSLDNPTNKRFVRDFLSSPYGQSGVTQSNMESTYLSLLFFQKAVEKIIVEQGVNSLSPQNIRNVSGGMTLNSDESPQGPIKIDPNNYNSWVMPKIGRFDSDGQVEIMLDREKWVEPKPFLLYPDRGVCKPDGLHLPSGKIVRSAS